MNIKTMGEDKVLKTGSEVFDAIEPKVLPTKKKPKKATFTIRHDGGLKNLLDEIQWLQQYVVKKSPVSQG